MLFTSRLLGAGAFTRAAVTCVALACAAPAIGQSPPPSTPLYGTLTASEEAEVAAWGVAYWQRLETGTAATPVQSFSNPGMNSPLFSPRYGTRATLERLKLLEIADSQVVIEQATQANVADWDKRKALKDAMTALKFVTDPVTNPNGTAAHVEMILDASTTSSLVTYTEGGKLVSEKLPLDVLVSAGADPQFASQLSVDTVNAINALVVACPGYASTAAGGTEAQKWQTGAPSKRDAVETRVRTLIHDIQVPSHGVDTLDASFGVYGCLPLVRVRFPDATVVIDALTGAVSSPVKPNTIPDASTAISAHIGVTVPPRLSGTTTRSRAR